MKSLGEKKFPIVGFQDILDRYSYLCLKIKETQTSVTTGIVYRNAFA